MARLNQNHRFAKAGLRKDDQMKHAKYMAIFTLLFVGVSGAAAQSLGDYARTYRKTKAETSSNPRYFDNDNLPVNDTLSVVGPQPADSTQATKPTALDNTAADADRQKTADEWAKKLDQQKQKIDSLNHDLDLEQREYRLRAAAMYGDAGNRLRNQAQWDKDDAQYKSDIDEKQKAIDAARQQLDNMQEEARKAGIKQKDNDSATVPANDQAKPQQ
jgi:hypothetical protein